MTFKEMPQELRGKKVIPFLELYLSFNQWTDKYNKKITVMNVQELRGEWENYNNKIHSFLYQPFSVEMLCNTKEKYKTQYYQEGCKQLVVINGIAQTTEDWQQAEEKVIFNLPDTIKIKFDDTIVTFDNIFFIDYRNLNIDEFIHEVKKIPRVYKNLTFKK